MEFFVTAGDVIVFLFLGGVDFAIIGDGVGDAPAGFRCGVLGEATRDDGPPVMLRVAAMEAHVGGFVQ